MTSTSHIFAALAVVSSGCSLYGEDPVYDPLSCGMNQNVVNGRCSDCPEGSTRAAGDRPYQGDTQCDADRCDVNEYAQGGACLACPPGSSNAAGDRANGSDTACDPIVCQLDERVEVNECVACPPGTDNEPGDEASEGDTRCDALLCGVNQRVASNECVACPNGTANSSGDDASGPDTACEGDRCDRNERVDANSCIACPLGRKNEPGDNTGGSDTTCDPVLCGEDERVDANVCVACGFELFNAAGDDASGDDTECNDKCFETFGVTCTQFGPVYFKPNGDKVSFGFGSAAAIKDDMIVIGAPSSRISTEPFLSGNVHTFNKIGSTWSAPFLGDFSASTAASTFGGFFFGSSLIWVGQDLAVGFPGDNSGARGINGEESQSETRSSGSVHIYEYIGIGSGWRKAAEIRSEYPDDSDFFGVSIASSGTTLAVGAFGEDGRFGANQDDNSTNDSGAVYTFTKETDGWSAQSYLKPKNSNTDDQFGYRVMMHDDLMFISALGEASSSPDDPEDNSMPNSGAVYVFRNQGGSWIQEDYIKMDTPKPNVEFGGSVVFGSNRLFVSAREDSNELNGEVVNNSGAVYVFAARDGKWTQIARISADEPGEGDSFGKEMAVENDMLFVGAPGEDGDGVDLLGDHLDDSATDSGAVYAFDVFDDNFDQVAYIKAPNTDAEDTFGSSLTVFGNYLVVGASNEQSSAMGVGGNQLDNSSGGRGAAYLYRIAP